MPKGVYVRKIFFRCLEGCTCYRHNKRRDRLCGVYTVINTVTGSSYIGSSSDLKHRIEYHKDLIEQKTHPRKKIREDSEKYGSEVFVYIVLQLCNPKNQYEAEQEWLQFIKPEYNSVYEAAIHGKGIHHSPEQNQNHSLIMKNKPGGFAGKTHSETSRLKMSKTRQETPLSLEHIANLYPVSFKGRTHSEETKRKISQTKKNAL